VANPRHPEHFDDPASIPVLTDVIVPGRPATPRPSAAHKVDTPAAPAGSAAEAPLPPLASAESEARAGVGEGPVPPTPAQARAETQPQPQAQPQAQPQYAPEAARAADRSEFVEPAKAVKPIESRASAEPIQRAEPQKSLPPLQPLAQAALTERDAEHIAERLRARFAGYLREEGRRVIETRCREALEEHTSWLVRQVTREVALVLEGEVTGWVRDAVREELAAHQASRR
jgi:hypothetical protein